MNKYFQRFICDEYFERIHEKKIICFDRIKKIVIVSPIYHIRKNLIVTNTKYSLSLICISLFEFRLNLFHQVFEKLVVNCVQVIFRVEYVLFRLSPVNNFVNGQGHDVHTGQGLNNCLG